MTTTSHIATDKIVAVNKYKLYFIVLAIVSGFFLLPKLYCVLTYSKTEGVVAGYHDEWINKGRHRYKKQYPLIRFNTATHQITFLAPSYMYELSLDRVTYPIIYSAKNPTKAYVFTFMGFLGNTFLFLGPFILVWSAFLLGPGFLPQTIRFNMTTMSFVKK
jgi:hypothetical protein